MNTDKSRAIAGRQGPDQACISRRWRTSSGARTQHPSGCCVAPALAIVCRFRVHLFLSFVLMTFEWLIQPRPPGCHGLSRRANRAFADDRTACRFAVKPWHPALAHSTLRDAVWHPRSRPSVVSAFIFFIRVHSCSFVAGFNPAGARTTPPRPPARSPPAARAAAAHGSRPAPRRSSPRSAAGPAPAGWRRSARRARPASRRC